MLKINLLFAYLVSIVAVCFFPVPSQAGEMHNLRGQRYCEILLNGHRYTPRRLHVYNTIGLNDCPSDLWRKITVEKIKKETGAAIVRLNGPRYWVIDGLENSNLLDPKIRTFGGIPMREAAVLTVGIPDIFRKQKPYQEHEVHRQTTWIYEAEKPIYELINPKSRVFVMQSYSLQKVKQTTPDLSNLGSTLQLPKGWHFRMRSLNKNAHLTPVNQKAVVIQDNFLNTYQQETPEFINETKM